MNIRTCNIVLDTLQGKDARLCHIKLQEFLNDYTKAKINTRFYDAIKLDSKLDTLLRDLAQHEPYKELLDNFNSGSLNNLYSPSTITHDFNYHLKDLSSFVDDIPTDPLNRFRFTSDLKQFEQLGISHIIYDTKVFDYPYALTPKEEFFTTGSITLKKGLLKIEDAPYLLCTNPKNQNHRLLVQTLNFNRNEIKEHILTKSKN